MMSRLGQEGKTEDHRPTGVTSSLLGDRLLLNDYTSGLWPQPHFPSAKSETQISSIGSLQTSVQVGTPVFLEKIYMYILKFIRPSVLHLQLLIL